MLANMKQRLRQAIDKLYSLGPATHETYTRLALDCFRANDVNQAKRLQTHMDLHLYQSHDTFLYNRLLHLYAKFGKVSYARNLFDKMPQRDIFSWNAMLSLYSKSGLIEDLWVNFNNMKCRDSVSYNTVISGLAGNGFAREALGAFVSMIREGFEPTEYTHVSVLNACTQLLDFRRGKEVHCRIVVGNLGVNVFMWNALTDMYSKCGEIDRARWLFDRVENKNVVSWNSMISGYLKNFQPEKSIALFLEMQVLGVKPDQLTVSDVLSAYFQTGCVEEASKLFAQITEKDKICWTAMIVGYARNGKEETALMLFNEMLSKKVSPDNYTISSVINCCAKLASLYHGQVLHGKSFLIGVDDDFIVSNAVIDMYCKCGLTQDAWAVFSTMPTRNVVSWNAMIRGYAQNGQDVEALSLYERMLQQNFKPDNITFVGVLSACVHAGLVEEGKKYFDSMTKLHGLTPTLDHHASMINLIGRSGSIDEAFDLLNSLPNKPNALIWSTVLSVCAMKGDVTRGEMAARHLFELDPLNAGPYIMLSNMYAACGRWKDVAYVRSLMKANNVKKQAAHSWIEIDNEVHQFVADDRTHPDAKLIYEELTSLIGKLQDIGFVPDTKLVLHDVGEREKFDSICYHSEKLALAYGFIRKRDGVTPIRILKNIRVCNDCHTFMKLISKITGRSVILRDSNRFHHFVSGECSCKDNW